LLKSACAKGHTKPLLLLLPQVGLHLGKNTARYASQLKVVAPQHPMALRAAAGEEMFDRAAAAMA
jgi:coatomer protein complex subunit epsilon